uniref:RING finger protein 207 n=1 Tax=Pseudonaja textilis TaxID=8673 RepID=A0A670ZIM0_PSETE
MSGGIFTPLENLCELDNANCHPLVCFLCHEQYEHPCLLDCYHNFCASCLRGRAIDSRLACPLCGHQSVVKGNGLPPEDQLLKFLVDSSGDYEEDVLCANCDLQSTKQLDAMYFCNTCSQPLCAKCREETHKARMFSRHEIVSLSKRAKEVHKKCPLHEELYIMFSTEKKSMLCINCFRDMPVESRAHCIDIETAYMKGCEKLDQAVMAVKELQTSTREAIVLLKAMIEEVRNSADEESSAINALFGSMQEKLAERKRSLLKAQLMERLQRIVKQPHRLRPSSLATYDGCRLARTLLSLFLGFLALQGRANKTPHFSWLLSRMSGVASSKTLLATGCSSSLEKMPLPGSPVRKATMHRYISTKVLLAEGRETPFTDHCRDYENTYRALQSEVQSLKDQVQELHRDLTKHHSLIRTEKVSEILQKSLQVDVQIASQFSSVEMRRTGFEETWEETYQRVANEQEIYEAQLHDLLQLRQENSYLTAITKQIGPYVRSIARVKERLEPRFQEGKERTDPPESLLKICEDGSPPAKAQPR